MPLEDKYDALIEKHRKIKLEIAAEMKRPLPDSMVLQRLKRQKLLLKDEIESWERLISAVRMKPVMQSSELHS